MCQINNIIKNNWIFGLYVWRRLESLSIRGRFLAAVILLLILSSSYGRVAATNIDSQNLRKKTENIGSRDINKTVLRGGSCILGGRASSDFQQVITYDQKSGLHRVEYDSSIYVLKAELDANLQVKHSEWQTTNNELIKRLGHDKRVTYYDPEEEVLKIEYYKGDKIKETKKFSYDEDILDSDLIYLYLNKVLTTDNQGANCDIILKSRGLKINVVFHQLSTKDLLSFTPQYSFLEGFRNFAQKIGEEGEELDVYVMNLTGVSKLFFPHKYYLAFKKTTPRQFVAYWGGGPKEAEFTFIE